VLLPIQSVGVMGDERTYENAVAVRAVTSQDGMTADWAKLPPELLGRISNRIINEVRGIIASVTISPASPRPPLSGSRAGERETSNGQRSKTHDDFFIFVPR